MDESTRTTRGSGDLFGTVRAPGSVTATRNPMPPELKAARALCRQLRRQKEPHDKQRTAHLICLTLSSMLRHGS